MVCNRNIVNFILKVLSQNVVCRNRICKMPDYFNFHLLLQMAQCKRREWEGRATWEVFLPLFHKKRKETIHSTHSKKDRRGVGSFHLTSENYLYAIRRYVNNWVSKPQNKQTVGVFWQWYFNISSPLGNSNVNLVQPTTLERQANTQHKTAIVHKMQM